MGETTALRPPEERIKHLELCVSLLFNVVMEGGDPWTMKGKARDVFQMAQLPPQTGSPSDHAH